MTAILHRPRSLDEACALLADRDHAAPAMAYGGGTAVQILLKQGVLFAADLVDLARVPGLTDIAETGSGLRVGAMVTLRRMETDPLVRRLAPLAAEVYGHVANPRVRNTASVGGNLAHGDYRLDPPTALLVLDARVELRGTGGTRQVPLREFFTGFQRTALRPGELVTAVQVPTQPSPAFGFVKLSSQSVNDWPCASAAALLTELHSGRRELRLGLGALADVPKYLSVEVAEDADLDAVLRSGRAAAESVIDPIPDIRGGVEFKRRLGLVAVEDAIRAAWRPPGASLGRPVGSGGEAIGGPGGGAVDTATANPAGTEDSDARRHVRRRWWRGR